MNHNHDTDKVLAMTHVEIFTYELRASWWAVKIPKWASGFTSWYYLRKTERIVKRFRWWQEARRVRTTPTYCRNDLPPCHP